MRVDRRFGAAGILLAALSITVAGCGAESTTVKAEAKAEPPVIDVVPVESRGIDRFLHVTGSLVADEQAEVSAEAAGRVVAVSVERGSPVSQGAVLVRISATETSAQLQEADSNAAQIEARLGLSAGQSFDPKRVPDVMNAKHRSTSRKPSSDGSNRSWIKRSFRRASTTSGARRWMWPGNSSRSRKT
jgi:multidrug efflux pump subunit AcrA (membrane-fusion protein)